MGKECGEECGDGCGSEHSTCQCACHTCGAPNCSGCAHMHGGKADPVKMSVIMWKQAFFSAMMESHKEKIKKKIEMAWGSQMDKAADAVVESMGKQWQSMMQDAGAEKELRDKLARMFSEGQKQK